MKELLPFYKGNLVSKGGKGPEARGLALTLFLKKIGFMPELIVLVEDSQSNLKDAEYSRASKPPAIRFLGIHNITGLELVESSISQSDFNLFWKAISQKAQKKSTLW
jgi:hypothetical protein